MRLRFLFAAAATLALAACGDSSTGPQQMRTGTRASDDDITCRSGYHIATRDDGSQYCEEDGGNTVLSGNLMGTSARRPVAPPDSQ
ncbi:MAG: hypothetical protein ABJE47_00240 [bacterium]